MGRQWPLWGDVSPYYGRNGSRRAEYFGAYTLTLTDISENRWMVGNLNKRPSGDGDADPVAFRAVGLHFEYDNTDAMVQEMVHGAEQQWAVSFQTATHAAGYDLDRVATFLRRGRYTKQVPDPSMNPPVMDPPVMQPPDKEQAMMTVLRPHRSPSPGLALLEHDNCGC